MHYIDFLGDCEGKYRPSISPWWQSVIC